MYTRMYEINKVKLHSWFHHYILNYFCLSLFVKSLHCSDSINLNSFYIHMKQCFKQTTFTFYRNNNFFIFTISSNAFVLVESLENFSEKTILLST